MADPRRVRLVENNGDLVFSGLLDDGSDVLRFASGLGFVTRAETTKAGRRLINGWTTQEEMARERARRWPHLAPGGQDL